MERRGRVRRPRVALRTDDLHRLDIGDIVTTNDGLLVHLRRSKTDQTGTGRTVAITATTSGDPLKAVAAWVHWRNGAVQPGRRLDPAAAALVAVVEVVTATPRAKALRAAGVADPSYDLIVGEFWHP
jgi:hypothetical protein